MCVHTAEPEIKPPSDVDIEIAIRKLQNGKQRDMIKFRPNGLKEEVKNSGGLCMV
jgi:hypothetical protein